MKQSIGFFPTLREIPKEAEARSHVLMLRAGLIRQLAAGLYTYLPLGWRTLRKISQIVREEMDAAGAIEILMPTLQPDVLWKDSGRWLVMGPEMMRIQDRNHREFVLGPTHEEVVTTLVAGEIRSYRDLPKNLYQIQTKFRDEVRPRFGVVRAREFVMKDGYSFDVDDAGAARSYKLMYDAYSKAFRRCGLTTIPVEADTGVMGGSLSHEFMVPADIGEAEIVSCSHCEYRANRELTEAPIPVVSAGSDSLPAMEKVHTPNLRTVVEVANFLQITPDRMIKTMIYTSEGKPFVVLLRGDHTINEAKLARAVGGVVEMASEEVIHAVTQAPVGFAGPMGLKGVEILADHSVKTIADGVTGANQADYHIRHVKLDRDFSVNRWGDFRCVEAGEICPKCGVGTLSIRFGIEVGHVFVLGTKYSNTLQAYYTDEAGQRKPMVMGCYGIGVSRLIAAVIEENADENGIVWPVSVAPYHVHLLNLAPQNPQVNSVSESLYEQIRQAGLEALMDDRDERPGIKFKDSDLMGLPYRIVVGEKNLKEGLVELVTRRTLKAQKMPVKDCVPILQEQYRQDLAQLHCS